MEHGHHLASCDNYIAGRILQVLDHHALLATRDKVCTSKSEAEVTNNKKMRLRYCTIDATKLTTDKHEAARGLFATAELLV